MVRETQRAFAKICVPEESSLGTNKFDRKHRSAIYHRATRSFIRLIIRSNSIDPVKKIIVRAYDTPLVRMFEETTDVCGQITHRVVYSWHRKLTLYFVSPAYVNALLSERER